EIAIQQAIPCSSNANGTMAFDVVEDLSHGDAVLAMANRVKQLFAPHGPLRHRMLSGNWEWLSLERDQPFDLYQLLSVGVMTSIIRLTYHRTVFSIPEEN
ncbi:MAG: hypothetical protein AAFP90_09080, partial [Planctomycetota bacterium]